MKLVQLQLGLWLICIAGAVQISCGGTTESGLGPSQVPSLGLLPLPWGGAVVFGLSALQGIGEKPSPAAKQP